MYWSKCWGGEVLKCLPRALHQKLPHGCSEVALAGSWHQQHFLDSKGPFISPGASPRPLPLPLQQSLGRCFMNCVHAYFCASSKMLFSYDQELERELQEPGFSAPGMWLPTVLGRDCVWPTSHLETDASLWDAVALSVSCPPLSFILNLSSP